MDPENGSCKQNLTEADIKHVALTAGAPGIACFLLNLVGLTAELIFVCTKKNTFFLRLYIYLSVAVTMSVGGYTSYTLMYFWPENKLLCQLLHSIPQYSAAVEFSIVISINIILLFKVSSTFRLRQGKTALMTQLSLSEQKCFEALFVTLNFGIPAVALSVFLGIERKTGICFTIKRTLDCFLEEGYVLNEVIIFELVPVLLDCLLSVMCVCVLLVWLCWVRTRLYLQVHMKTVIKEVGAWLGFLVIYCVAMVLIESSDFTNNTLIKFIAFVCYPLLHSCIPVLFFVYMCVSLCPCCGKNRTRDTSVQTGGLQTTRKSTRVSLPSDTAAHAPNFLSPIEEEDFTVASPLLA